MSYGLIIMIFIDGFITKCRSVSQATHKQFKFFRGHNILSALVTSGAGYKLDERGSAWKRNADNCAVSRWYSSYAFDFPHIVGGINVRRMPALPVVPIFFVSSCNYFCTTDWIAFAIPTRFILSADNLIFFHFRFLSERKEPRERKAEVIRNTNGRITLKHCVSKSSGHLVVHLDSVARYALRIKFSIQLLHSCLHCVSSNTVVGGFLYCWLIAKDFYDVIAVRTLELDVQLFLRNIWYIAGSLSTNGTFERLVHAFLLSCSI